MPITAELEQVYCTECHLATPTWRKKCIHCTAPLNLAEKPVSRKPEPYVEMNGNGVGGRSKR